MSGEPIGPVEARYRGEPGRQGEPGPGLSPLRAYGIVVLFALAFLVAVAAVTGVVTEVSALQREVRSQCKFDADLAGVPVSLNPATNKPSVLGIKIVSDSRVAWRQAGCPGTLPAPSPSFTRWARFYHLPTG
jgi:hypothetical protein